MYLLHEPELIRIDHVDHSTLRGRPTQGSRSENHERDRSLLASPPLPVTGPDTLAVRLQADLTTFVKPAGRASQSGVVPIADYFLNANPRKVAHHLLRRFLGQALAAPAIRTGPSGPPMGPRVDARKTSPTGAGWPQPQPRDRPLSVS